MYELIISEKSYLQRSSEAIISHNIVDMRVNTCIIHLASCASFIKLVRQIMVLTIKAEHFLKYVCHIGHMQPPTSLIITSCFLPTLMLAISVPTCKQQ